MKQVPICVLCAWRTKKNLCGAQGFNPTWKYWNRLFCRNIYKKKTDFNSQEIKIIKDML